MPHPTLEDDGQTVTLDLHGASVEEALDLARRVLRAAARRGRRSVRIVHGRSTSSRTHRNRTIKHALYDLLDRHALDDVVTSQWRAEAYLLLSLDVTAAVDAAPLRLLDVLR